MTTSPGTPLCGIELISARFPDETTILTFRHQLNKHALGEQIFEIVKAHLSARGMTMRQGTIVDTTLIAAPSSTKNKEGKRDPEMHNALLNTPDGRVLDLIETAKAHIRSKA